MAGRPQKYTVDYFSHDANASSGKTLTVLFNNFGHEGISIWWQLLESLSLANNHFIKINNSDDLEYLAARMRLKTERLREILNKMADLEAIDAELYKIGIIWSDNFVKRLSPVYDSRKQPLPIKPNITFFHPMAIWQINSINSTDNPISLANNSIKLPDNTQTKETKLKETKLKRETKGNSPNGSGSFEIPEWVNKETWEAFLEMRKRQKAVPTEHAKDLLFQELEKLRLAGNDPNEVLNQSIMNNYKGVFALKNSGGNGSGTNQQRPSGNTSGHSTQKSHDLNSWNKYAN